MPRPDALECCADAVAAPTLQAYPGRPTELGGGLTVQRMLPHRGRRLVGPWCFLDHLGPVTFDSGKPMDVAPHPHIGLQTVTWIIEGEGLHKDSLGNEQLLLPGQLNLMTAGRGIAHSEETPPRNSGRLHGVQLWVALPDAQRHVEPAFDHHSALPAVTLGDCRATVLIGTLAGARSPAQAYSPIIGAELVADCDGACDLPLDPEFEYALLMITGAGVVDECVLDADTLYYLGTARNRLALQHRAGTRLMLVGGAPFGENILMWWNFVARTPEEIAAARTDWERRERFGEVAAYAGRRLAAPPFEARLKRPGNA